MDIRLRKYTLPWTTLKERFVQRFSHGFGDSEDAVNVPELDEDELENREASVRGDAHYNFRKRRRLAFTKYTPEGSLDEESSPEQAAQEVFDAAEHEPEEVTKTVPPTNPPTRTTQWVPNQGIGSVTGQPIALPAMSMVPVLAQQPPVAQYYLIPQPSFNSAGFMPQQVSFITMQNGPQLMPSAIQYRF